MIVIEKSFSEDRYYDAWDMETDGQRKGSSKGTAPALLLFEWTK